METPEMVKCAKSGMRAGSSPASGITVILTNETAWLGLTILGHFRSYKKRHQQPTANRGRPYSFLPPSRICHPGKVQQGGSGSLRLPPDPRHDTHRTPRPPGRPGLKHRVSRSSRTSSNGPAVRSRDQSPRSIPSITGMLNNRACECHTYLVQTTC